MPLNDESREDCEVWPAGAEAVLRQLAGTFFDPSLFDRNASAGPASPAGAVPRPDTAALYKTLVEQIPALIFMAFLDQRLSEAYVSPHVESVLGFTQQEWLNDPVRWYKQIHPDDRTRWSVEAAEFIVSGKPLRSIYRVIARDGRVVWFRCDVKLVVTRDGRPWFLHGAAFDVTDLKEAEIALQQARDGLDARIRERTRELAEANRTLEQEIAERKRAQAGLARSIEELMRSNADLRQFAYSASHDLQEPLRNISIYSQWLKARYRGSLDAQADQFIDFVTEGAQRMSAMIRGLLEYTRTANDNEQVHDATDANAGLAKVLADLQELISDNDAEITCEPLPPIAVREVHFRQILQNLIANAIKYRSSEPPRIHISSSVSNRFCLFSLTDNGVGIAPEFHQKIFGIFTRLQERSHASGTGIGLAICKRIVERYDGRIWVESELGRGAVFRFTLPVADAAEDFSTASV